MSYSGRVTRWSRTLVPATAANVASAIRELESWSALGGTGTYGAVQTALSIPGIQAVYLLSDGAPDGSTSAIVSAARRWSRPQAKATIPVNTIAFVQNLG